MWSLNARFRRLRRLANSYMDGLTLGELEELVVQLIERKRASVIKGARP